MNTKLFVIAAATSLLFATAAYSGNQPDFNKSWHGHGSNHQGNNDPGDTADDRHNFGDATAGNSGKNPTSNSNQPEH